MEKKPNSLLMLQWQTEKEQRNLEAKERIELVRLVKETVPKALGEKITFEYLWLIYMLNNEDFSLTEDDLIDEILETLELQLGEEAEIDESNLIFVIYLIYESFGIKSFEIRQPPEDSEIEKVTT
jgi:hypothetical protein